MADQGLHALNDERSLAERYFWLWIALAFVVGLVPGALGLLWYRNSSAAYAKRLVAQSTALAAKNDKLAADNKQLESEVASVQAGAASGSSSSSGGDTTGTAPVPAPKAGEIVFVSRSVSPSMF